MAARARPTGAPLHLLQQMPSQCAEEPARMLRGESLRRRLRGDDQGNPDRLRAFAGLLVNPAASPAAGNERAGSRRRSQLRGMSMYSIKDDDSLTAVNREAL